MSNVEIEFRLDQPARRPKEEARPQKVAPPRVPRIARLMALAIKVQEMVDRGEMRDYAEVARLGHVTRARMTQIMNLLNLAPDIQEHILFATPDSAGSALAERNLRQVSSAIHWREQRARFKAEREKTSCPSVRRTGREPRSQADAPSSVTFGS
jgi:hypothetical protein